MSHEAPKLPKKPGDEPFIDWDDEHEYIVDMVSPEVAKGTIANPSKHYAGFATGERVKILRGGGVTELRSTTELHDQSYPTSLTLKAENIGRRALSLLHLRKPRVARVYKRNREPSETAGDSFDLTHRGLEP